VLFLWAVTGLGIECGKNKSNENFKTPIASKTTGECGIF